MSMTLSHKGQRQDLTTRFVIGCDGAHSVVRHLLNLSFEGAEYTDLFLLADVETNESFPPTAPALPQRIRARGHLPDEHPPPSRGSDCCGKGRRGAFARTRSEHTQRSRTERYRGSGFELEHLFPHPSSPGGKTAGRKYV